MKEGVLDILEFLFDHYMMVNVSPFPDEAHLADELEHAGFDVDEIDKALVWLEGLGELEAGRDGLQLDQRLVTRVFMPAECEKLSLTERSLLYKLERMGILDSAAREIIIDRAMAIQVDELSFEDFKQIVAFVVLNRESSPSYVSWAERFLFDTEGALIRH
ncbi:MAG: DUF494 domain-containing protein [Pseudomonadota bacterium]